MSVRKDYTAEREQGELLELEAKIDAKAMTCRERREMLAEYLGVSPEEYAGRYGDLELHEEELQWLQSRVKEENKDLDIQLEQFNKYLRRSFNTQEAIEDEDQISDSDLDKLGTRLEEIVIAEKRRLERKLLLMTLKARRPAIFRLKAYMPSFRRARSRAPRSARRASFSVAASSPGGGDSSGDPDSGDPPGPYPFRISVVPPSNRKHNQEPSRPWLGLGCCRMERGRSA